MIKATRLLCIYCKHWHFYGGSQGYSDMTPGADASMECRKSQYKGSGWSTVHDMHEDDFRELLEKAQTCKHFKWRDMK